MDLRQALLTEIDDRLTGDAILQGICGGTVRLVNGMAPPNTAFPYLTHRFTVEVGASWALADGTWLLDLWDHSPNSARLLSIRHRVITLMDKLVLTPADEDIIMLQIDFARESEGPTDAPDVHRLMTQWSLNFDRQVEVEAVF